MKRYILAIALLCAPAAFGQGYRYDNFVLKPLAAGGVTPVSGALITVCTSAGTGTPCTPKVANIYSNEALSAAITGTGGTGTTNSDANGNFGFYIAPGSYVITVTGTGFTSYTINVTLPCNVSNCTFGGTMTFTGALNTKQFESTNWYADQYCSGSVDVSVCINNTLAAMPSSGGYKFGTIRLDGFAPGTAWVWNTLVTISSPYVSIRGPGSAALQITASVLTGDHLRINTNPFIASLAGIFEGFSLVGGSQNNAVCIHMGDIIGPELHDIRCSNFSGTGAVGLWLDNVTTFTERVVLNKVHMDSCTKDIKLTNTANVAGTASFGHQVWEAVFLNVGANQIGISYESGTFYSDYAKITINESATTSTGIGISGLAYAAGPGAAWTGSLVVINAETGAGSGTLFNVGAGNSCLLGGMLTTGGGLTNAGAGIASCVMYMGNALANVDLSNNNLGVGTLQIGGTPTATNVPQFLANNAGLIAGIAGSNYYVLRAGVAALESHSTAGDLGLAGRLNLTAAPAGSAGNASFGASGGVAQLNNNNGTTFPVSQTVISGTSTLTSNAALAAVTSQAAITTAATGALTTDSIEWAFATAPTAGDNLCHVLAYVTAGNVNFVRTNPTAAAANVTALVINWRIVR